MRIISALLFVLVLSACGGGSDGDSLTPSASTPLPVSVLGEAATENAPDPAEPTVSLSLTAPFDDLNPDPPSITTLSSTPSTFCGYTAGGSRIAGIVSKVQDGDTITVAGNSIRLDSIDAPELKQAYGIQSRDNLSNLVNGQQVTVTYAKKDRYGRIVGTVFKSDCTQVNLRQVEAGSAWYYDAYKCEISAASRNSYANAESLARNDGRGLWASSAISPWVYRNGVEAKVPASCRNGDSPSWEIITSSSSITAPSVISPSIQSPTTCQARIWVNPYTRKDGTKVKGHWRTNPRC
jgi:endonuclease YncB( thermonuclease family)